MRPKRITASTQIGVATPKPTGIHALNQDLQFSQEADFHAAVETLAVVKTAEVAVMHSKVIDSYLSEALKITSSRNSSSIMIPTRSRKRSLKFQLYQTTIIMLKLPEVTNKLILALTHRRIPMLILHIQTITVIIAVIVLHPQILNTLRGLDTRRSRVSKS
jgi:hypothetical protein